MRWRKWLENWDMTSLKISTPFLDMEWKPQAADKEAVWELYVELLTRVSTQGLPPDEGDEIAALDSIHELFDLTRAIIKRHGRDCLEFTKIAVVVLNQVIRPFTAQWHLKSLEDSLGTVERPAFRADLAALQIQLRNYTKMLADMAGVEDLTALEDR